MSARRPLLTALGATTLLAALWFVPSAGAAAPGAEESRTGVPAGANAADASADGTGTADAPTPLALADTGSVDTTPYLLGGTLCLGVGAGFVVFSVRRSHSL
ncbi:hypothetical protein WKI68_17820 [Streptomyces sp. MS1.HAVA.3]|uniref:LPXTG cell wall anchor domain-containing protein n=1 Tax=Streptomyces caledonius TaxID=3134107 RepID=A0ABU8U4E0_9ACTN